MSTTWGNPDTFAGLLANAKAVMVANGSVGTADNIKLSDRPAMQPPTGTMVNEMWVIAPGEHWTWQDGIEFSGDSDLLLTGDLTVAYWLRTTTDGQMLADNLLTDAILGNTTKVGRLLSLFAAEDSTARLQDGSSITPLTRPLQFKYLSFLNQPVGTPWRGVLMSWDCQFRAKSY